jgi:hypothetical protein
VELLRRAQPLALIDSWERSDPAAPAEESIISRMNEYNFYYPIEVRYGDLDPQGHVNNAKYLTYMEQARVAYIRRLGVWKGDSFLDIGIILADAAGHLPGADPVRDGCAGGRAGLQVGQ